MNNKDAKVLPEKPNRDGWRGVKTMVMFLKTMKTGILTWFVTVLIVAFIVPPLARAQSSPQPVAPATTDNSATAPALPPGIDSKSPLGQIVQMLQSGAAENAILADISQSSGPFNLNAADIAYLNDLGAPGDIEQAIIQRDKALGVRDVPQVEQTAPPDQNAQTQDVTEDYFYGALSPYGRWTNFSGYGLCWQPYAAINNPGWSPYCTQGQWIYTDCGWYWLSGYSWGWCAFHYGRWFHDASRGWCWWPSTTWAPSWVFWRYGGNYCGWAPLPPGCYYSQGNGVVYNGAAVAREYDFGIGASLFTFIPMANLSDSNTERFHLPAAQAVQVFARSKVLININSNDRIIVNDGIPVRKILMATGKVMRSVTIQPVESVAAPGAYGEQILADGETLVINRPYFQTDVASALRQGIWPVPSQEQPVAHQPPSFIVNENPASYSAADNQDNSVIYVDSAAQDAPPVPTVTTAGPQDYAAPVPSFAAGPDQSYWSVSAEARAPVENASIYMSPRGQSHERWQHRVPQDADHHEFNPQGGDSRPGGHPPTNPSDGHASHPEQGHGDEHGSGGAPSQSHSAPTDAGAHDGKK
jgi:hypothetical protein